MLPDRAPISVGVEITREAPCGCISSQSDGRRVTPLRLALVPCASGQVSQSLSNQEKVDSQRAGLGLCGAGKGLRKAVVGFAEASFQHSQVAGHE